MNNKGTITGLSNAVINNVEIEEKINETISNADFSNPAHLKILFEMQTTYYKGNKVVLVMLAEAIEYIAEQVGNMPQLKGDALVDKINEICAEIDDNTASIKKIQKFIDDKKV